MFSGLSAGMPEPVSVISMRTSAPRVCAQIVYRTETDRFYSLNAVLLVKENGT